MRFAHPFLCLLAATAAALAPCSVSAQLSNVQVYGIVDMYAGRSATSGVPTRANVFNSGGMTTSYWGIGGLENLGGGLTATFAVEGFMRVDTGESGRTPGDPMFSRAANVGLNDHWGAVKIGRVPNPLFQTSAQLNPYGFSTRFSPLMTQMWIVPYGSSSAGDSGWNNALHYTSPSVGGFNFVGQYGLGEHAANSPGDNKVALLKYTSPTLSGAVAAQEIGNGIGITNAAPKQRTVFAGAAYDFKAAKAFASYSRNRTDGSGRDTKTAHIGLAVPQGAGKWLLAWARATERANVKAPFRRNTAAAGYDYNMSVRTDVYAVYLYDKLTTARSGNTYAVGIRHRY